MQSDFRDATAVRRAGAGAYAAEIAPGWDIAGNANGGYLIAIAARAMADAAGRPPLTLTAHYLAPGRPGPCEIDVDVVRSGRRMATVAAKLRTGDGDVLALLGTFAPHGQDGEDGPVAVDGTPPELPPMEDCVRIAPPFERAGFGARVRALLRPEDAAFRQGRPSGRAELCGWFELASGEPIDLFALLVATDAFPPVIFNRTGFALAWAPTLELTVHVRGVPAPGPLRCRFRNRFVRGGTFEEDGEVWDSRGALVAQSRQLALVPRGRREAR